MRRRSTHALLLAALMLPCAQAAVAQQASAQSKSADASAAREAAERRAEVEKKAVALLREAVADSQGLKLAENRVRPQTAAAALLWARDEQTARALFKSAADAIAAYGASLDPEDPQFYNDAQSASQMRGELIQSVAQFDPKLALEYLRSTRLPFAEALRASGYQTDAQEQQLELSLASRVASQDPASALRMAERGLSKSMTSALLPVLQELRRRDPAAASKLAAEIVKRLRAADLANNYEASSLAFQLLSLAPADAPAAQQSSQPAVMVVDGPGEISSVRPAAVDAQPLMSGQTRAELVEKIIAAALSDATNQSSAYNLCAALRALVPEFERTNPSRAEALRRRADALERGFNPQADTWRPYKETMESGTIDAMLEVAPKAPPEIREQLYNQAAWKAYNEGDLGRAREIAEHISNPQQRSQMRKNFETQAIWRDATQGNFAAARSAAARLTTAEERMSALMQIASVAQAKGDAREARQALDDARAFAPSQASGQQQFRAQMQLAAAYAPFEPGQSFEMVESGIARLNELLDNAAAIEGFGQESFKDGELRPQYGYVWSEMVSLCTNALASLAPSDFERASAAAKSFRRADVRAAAEMQLAQSVLNSLSRSEFQTNRSGVMFAPLLNLRRRGGE
jgi:hypothetical protein